MIPILSPSQILELLEVVMELLLDRLQGFIAGEPLEPVLEVGEQLLFGVEHKSVLFVHHQLTDTGRGRIGL